MAASVRPRPIRFRTTLATAPRRPRQRLGPAAAPIRRRHPAAAAAKPVAAAPNMLEWWLAGLLVLITAAAGLASLAEWLHLT